MKIAILYGPRDLRIEDQPLDTSHLQPDEIWVETRISALKIGTDRGNYEGAERVPGASWHETLDSLPTRGPLLIVANEFFDALPIRQLIATPAGWRERVVIRDGDRFAAVPGPLPMDAAVPDALRPHASFQSREHHQRRRQVNADLVTP